MAINGIEDLISAALRWVGLENEDPRSDLAKALSKNDDFVSTFHVAETRLPEVLPEMRHPIFDPRPSISSGDEGGGGSGGPYRTPDPVTPVPSDIPAVQERRDSRDAARGIDWELVSRPEYQRYSRNFFDGLTYADLRLALEVYEVQHAGGDNPADLLLRELEANIRRCNHPDRRSGDPLFRLEVLTEAEFRRAIRQVLETRGAFRDYSRYEDGGSSEYRDILLRRDSLVDALTALPTTDAWERRASYEAAIRRLDARLPHVSLYQMDLGHLSEARLIESSGDARLPRRREATFHNVESQVRMMLPEPMRSGRYDSFIARTARLICDSLERLPDAERNRLFREELARRGSILGGMAPESLVLSSLENQFSASESDAPVRELLRARIEEIRSNHDHPVTRELAETLRRAGRLVER